MERWAERQLAEGRVEVVHHISRQPDGSLKTTPVGLRWAKETPDA
jgi:hypothetical protein